LEDSTELLQDRHGEELAVGLTDEQLLPRLHEREDERGGVAVGAKRNYSRLALVTETRANITRLRHRQSTPIISTFPSPKFT
jgi:hypothetical protein